jgi:hypothetical protein
MSGYAGWWARGKEMEAWRVAFRAMEERATALSERLLSDLLSMRRAGFVPTDGSGEEEETWVIDNQYEAEVSERRRQAGITDLRERFRAAATADLSEPA